MAAIGGTSVYAAVASTPDMERCEMSPFDIYHGAVASGSVLSV